MRSKKGCGTDTLHASVSGEPMKTKEISTSLFHRYISHYITLPTGDAAPITSTEKPMKTTAIHTPVLPSSSGCLCTGQSFHPRLRPLQLAEGGWLMGGGWVVDGDGGWVLGGWWVSGWWVVGVEALV
jgi:hypothetical protein